MGTAAAVITAVGVGASAQQGRQSAKAQKKASKVEQRLQDIRTAKERRKQVRAAAAVRAEQAVLGQTTGTTASTLTSARSGSITNQLGENLSFLDTAAGLTRNISHQRQVAANRQQRASTYGAVANLALLAEGQGLFD